jgi:hypothetical protein
MDTETQDDPWSVLSSLALVECDACGHQNARSLKNCEECQAALATEDDEPGFNFVSGAGRAQRLQPLPIEKAKHLQKMKALYEAKMAGGGSDAELKATIVQYHQMMSYAHEYMKSQRAKDTLGGMAPDEIKMAERLLAEIEELFVALGLMKRYFESNKLSDLSDGFAQFEDSMLEVSRIQGDAFDQANQFDD